MYYVYEWFILTTGEIIYVGKGTGLRYKVKKHNKLFNEMIKRYPCYSRVIKTFDTEQEAFEYEYDYINQLKQSGQCVCNIRAGGNGGSTEWWTDEARQKYSERNVMKSEAQRKRMSEHNPMKNKATAKKVNSQKRKAVIIGDIGYPSIKIACKALNTSWEVIANWCRKGVNPKGEKCRYAGMEQVEFSDNRYNKGSCKGLTYIGKHYESPVDLAKEMECNVAKIYHWLMNGFDTKGNPIRYDGDENTYVYKPNARAARPVIVNGIRYPSIYSAAKQLGTSSTLIGDILKGKFKSTKYICEYDNQQPSQGNVEDSTLEGSTTNG